MRSPLQRDHIPLIGCCNGHIRLEIKPPIASLLNELSHAYEARLLVGVFSSDACANVWVAYAYTQRCAGYTGEGSAGVRPTTPARIRHTRAMMPSSSFLGGAASYTSTTSSSTFTSYLYTLFLCNEINSWRESVRQNIVSMWLWCCPKARNAAKLLANTSRPRCHMPRNICFLLWRA